MIWVGQNSIAYHYLLVIYVCLKRGKNLTLKTCAPEFSARSMTKLYAQIKSHSLTFLKLGRYAAVTKYSKNMKMTILKNL